MGKQKKKLKKKTDDDLVILSSAERWIKRAELTEEVILGLIVAVATLLFTTDLNSHFTLPKITVTSFLVIGMLIPLLIRVRLKACYQYSGLIPVALGGLSIWWLVASTQAMHVQTALEGQYGRYNALYTNLMLVTLFFAVMNMRLTTKRLKRIVLTGLVILMPVCLYGFVQYLGLDTVFKSGFGARPPSSVGNPVALATVLLLYLPFAIMIASYPGKLQQRLSYLLIALILIITVLLTGSRGPWAGLVISVVIMAVLSLFLTRDINVLLTRKNVIIAFVCLLLIGFVLSLEGVRSRFSLGAGFDIRLMYYLVSLDIIKDSPLFGFGFESFRLIYPEYRPEHDWQIVKDTTPTMIHNDYLQLSADNGLPALLFYTLLLGGLLWGLFQLFRSKAGDKRILIAMLATILGYLAQANFGWLEAGSSIIYWLVLGLCAGYLISHQPKSNSEATNTQGYVVTGIAIVGVLFSLYYGLLMSGKVVTDYSLRKAQQNVYANFALSKSHIDEIAASRHDNFYYQDQLGLLYMKRTIRSGGKENYEKAREYLFRSAELNPFDAYVRIHIMENDMIAMRKRIISRPSQEAIQAAKEAVEIDPNNPSTHRVAASIYGLNRQQAERIKHLKRMKELKEFDWKGVDERGSLFSGAHK